MHVELLPWRHDIESEAHAKVIAHINQLRKNSTLLFESSPGELIYLGRCLDLVSGIKPAEMPSGYDNPPFPEADFWEKYLGKPELLKTKLGRDDWAFLEVIHACRKRNIKIIPLETPNSRFLGLRGEFVRGTKLIREWDVHRYRDRVMARLANINLKTLREESVTLLSGAGHTDGIEKHLVKLAGRAITTSVNEEINNCCQKCKNESEAELDAKTVRREQFIEELRRYRITQETRTKKRLEQRKNKSRQA